MLPRLPFEAIVVQCAAKRGLGPDAFRAMPIDDQAMCVAEMLFTATCEAYRWQKSRKQKAENGNKYSKETNPYYQLLRGMGMAEPRPGQ